MSKFEYMDFYGDEDTEFVVHAKKFTKEQAINLFVSENINSRANLRVPKVEDILERRVRYFVKRPEYCGHNEEGGCYTYCGQSKGSFPVWVVEYSKLRKERALT